MSYKGKSSAKSHELSLRVADEVQLGCAVVENVVNLLENDNTVPFIARYRRNESGNLEVDKIRLIKEVLEQTKAIEDRKDRVLKAIGENASNDVKKNLKEAKTMQDVEDIYSPFKTGGKGTLANRARSLGLDKAVEMIHNNPQTTNLDMFIKPSEKGVSSSMEVVTGVQHILADEISKNKDVWGMLKNVFEGSHITLESNVSKTGKDDQKYKEYHKKSINIKYLKSHQILALNRAEGNKIVQIKVNCPDSVSKRFLNAANGKYVEGMRFSDFSRHLMETSIKDCLNRLLLPKLIRHKRSELTKNAEHEAVQVFSRNLRRLLLTPPVRNRSVLGMDPGFAHGCKLAVVDKTGNILNTNVIYPFGPKRYVAENILEEILKKHNCYTIALGNGTACRETECFISSLKKSGRLPKNVVYSVVSEDGASIYSVSKEAEAEMPKLDVNLRSAVSIARRLQNPLLELIKINPKNLGVGMYQHDMPDSLLMKALNGVLEDCVSLVGVDLNTAGVHALRLIAGLNERRAKAIVTWRDQNGSFCNRVQLKKVVGIGEKTFEQCAGFVRIMSAPSEDWVFTGDNNDNKNNVDQNNTSNENECNGRKRKATENNERKKKIKVEKPIAYNKLDATCIHPESYDLAEKIMTMSGTQSSYIGQPLMKEAINSFIKTKGLSSVCKELNSDEKTISFIVNGLCQSLGEDLRADFAEPLFRQGVITQDNLKPNQVITGRVTNVTTFGAFVDIGVENNGLIHVTKLPGANINKLGVGDIVEVMVESVNGRKISLMLKNIKNRNVELR